MNLSKLLSTFFYIGYIPIGSGTVASLVVVFLWYFLNSLAVIYFILLCILLIILAYYVTKKSLDFFKSKDPSQIVIDEVVGMLVSLIGVGVSVKNAIIAFVLFRIFDIFKPLYIRRLEKIHGAIGVISDDILAGIYTMIILNLYNYYLGGFTWH